MHEPQNSANRRSPRRSGYRESRLLWTGDYWAARAVMPVSPACPKALWLIGNYRLVPGRRNNSMIRDEPISPAKIILRNLFVGVSAVRPNDNSHSESVDHLNFVEALVPTLIWLYFLHGGKSLGVFSSELQSKLKF